MKSIIQYITFINACKDFCLFLTAETKVTCERFACCAQEQVIIEYIAGLVNSQKVQWWHQGKRSFSDFRESAINDTPAKNIFIITEHSVTFCLFYIMDMCSCRLDVSCPMLQMCMDSYRELMSAGTVRGMKEDPTQMMVSVVQVHPEGHLKTRFAPKQLTVQERNRKRSRQWCTGRLRAALLMLEAEKLSTRMKNCRSSQLSHQHDWGFSASSPLLRMRESLSVALFLI